jgi:methionyl-tRNA synthetase
VGKLINLASRCSAFLEKNSDLMLSKDLEDEEKFKIFLTDIDEIKNFYAERKYSNAISKIMLMTDKANQYINEKKPWSIQDLEEVQKISTQGLNYFRTLVILLSPVMPDLQKKTEDMLNEKNLTWNDSFKPLLNKKIKKFVTLKNRIQKEDIQKLKDELTNINVKTNVEEKSMTNEIEYDDFSKIDLRIGEILEAINVEGADKLLKLKVNLGDLGDKEIFAGIKKSYKPEDLIGMKTIVVANLKPKTMKFGTSSAMVLAASSDGEIIVIEADSKIKNGSKVK